MKYLWDTNTCIAHLRGSFPALTERLAVEGPYIALCSVVVSEILYGILRSRDPVAEGARAEHFLQRLVSLPFDTAAATHAAEVRAHLHRAGTPIGPYDIQIAAIALAHGLTVVTHNTDEFRRVPGLVVEEWEASG